MGADHQSCTGLIYYLISWFSLSIITSHSGFLGLKSLQVMFEKDIYFKLNALVNSKSLSTKIINWMSR